MNGRIQTRSRIRIRAKGRIWIRIKVKSRIRTRFKVMGILLKMNQQENKKTKLTVILKKNKAYFTIKVMKAKGIRQLNQFSEFRFVNIF
jgi:hypothetical protein